LGAIFSPTRLQLVKKIHGFSLNHVIKFHRIKHQGD
jgi:hypothetical protein